MSDKSTMQSTAPEPPLYRVPAHGKGRLRILQPGETANPSGRNGRYGEVTRMCRDVGPRATRYLIGIMDDPGEDTRCRIVAIQEILNRGFGKIREMSESELRDAPALDLEAVSEAKLELVIRALEAARDAKRAQAQGGEGDGGEITQSRAAERED